MRLWKSCAPRRGGHRRSLQSEHDVPRTTATRLAAQKKTVHDSQRDTARVKRERRAIVDYREDELRPLLDRLHFLDEFGAIWA